MKTMKKTMALLLALVMLFALAVPAMAATATTGSITINNATPGATYKAYRIFDLESYDADNGLYYYTVNSAWTGFVTGTGAGAAYVDVSKGYVTWETDKQTGTDLQAFAEAALKYAETKGISATKTASCGTGETSVEMTGLDLGYYVIDTVRSGAKTLCILTTTDPDAAVSAKSEIPTPDKVVQEDSDSSWGKTNDADIGQIVNFKSTINIKDGYTQYVMHDKMSEGLTFIDITSVQLKHGGTTTEVDASYYTVVDKTTVDPSSNPVISDGCTFEIAFDEAFCATLESGNEIIVSYTAKLNEKAIIGGTGNPNDNWIKYYDNETEYESVKSETVTYTWELGVFKYTMKEDKAAPLSGAEFKLQKQGTDALVDINFVDITVEGGTPTYRVAKTDDTETVTTITTDAKGKFVLQGLDSDIYYLVETKAPAGYNKLDDSIEVKMDSEGNVSWRSGTDAAAGGVELEYIPAEDGIIGVLNQTGAELPETGGIGTTIFYVLGAALVVGALVVLVTRKRMSNNG